MPERLSFDDRLLNRFTVENLRSGFPALHHALATWFTAFGDFDDTSLTKLIAARGPADIERWRQAAQTALAAIPAIAQTLDMVEEELNRALASCEACPERQQLVDLLDSARVNRVTLVERAPALAAGAIGSASDSGRLAAAAAHVERAVRQLDRMRARSEAPDRPYRELQPMVAELRALWATLDRELAALSRGEQRTVRAPHEGRLRESAGVLCRNLFARKTRDRAAGIWPLPEISAPDDRVPERFAATLARGAYADAQGMLAPWLVGQWSPERLAEEMGRSVRTVMEAAGLRQPPPPGAFLVAVNPMRYEDVRQLSRDAAPIPSELTAENFRGWFPVRIQTEEEDAYLTDIEDLVRLRVATVSSPAGERIGYIEFEQ